MTTVKRQRVTVKEAQLQRDIEMLQSTIGSLQRENRQTLDILNKRAVERDQLQEQIVVLQSDRDRLTAALEVSTRRLASPAADKDVSRGGWRREGLNARDFTQAEHARG